MSKQIFEPPIAAWVVVSSLFSFCRSQNRHLFVLTGRRTPTKPIAQLNVHIIIHYAGGPVAGQAQEVIMPKVSDSECAQFWGIPASLRMCAGYTSAASRGICSVSVVIIWSYNITQCIV